MKKSVRGSLNLALAFLLIAGIVYSVTFVADQLEPQGVVIRVGHDSKESSPLHQALLRFEAEVESRSQTEIQVEIFAARQLGDVLETTEMVQQGNLQMTVGASVLLTSIVPEFNVLDLFYLFDDEAHAHAALDDPTIGGRLLSEMQNKGFHGIGFMEVGFRNVTSSRRPIVGLSDFDGIRMRSAANPTQIAAWEAVGASPVPLAWGEIFTSLQQGLIDSQESAVYSVFAERFFEVQRYLSMTGHMYTNYVLFANLKFWQSLDDAQRYVVEESAAIAIVEQRRLAALQNTQILGDLQNAGIQVNSVSSSAKAEIRDQMNAAVFEEIRSRTGASVFDELYSAIRSLETGQVNESD